MYTMAPFGRFSYNRERFKRALIDAVMTIDGPHDKRVYDIGCGRGYWFRIFSGAGFHQKNIIGLDQSRSALNEAGEANPNVVEGDVLHLPFQTNSADLVFCNGVLHHTADVAQGFEELCRVLRPGGELLLSVYNLWHPYFILVYKGTWPIRIAYWRWSKKAYFLAWIMAFPVAQILALIILRKPLGLVDFRTLLMDQVFTPYAKVFSERALKTLSERGGVEFIQGGLHTLGFMRFAKYRKPGGELSRTEM